MNNDGNIPGEKAQTSKASAKKIFIVEDHPIFREGLQQMISLESDLMVCGEADNATSALELIPSLQLDLVLVDLTLPGKSGLQLIKDLRALGLPIKMLVVSMHDEALYADRVLRAGGDGYIMKQEDPEEIIRAIKDVLAGHTYVSEEVMASLRPASVRATETSKSSIDQLTDMEVELLELLGHGHSNQQMAAKLDLSVQAVRSHCARMTKKLNLEGTNALIRHAVCWTQTGGA